MRNEVFDEFVEDYKLCIITGLAPSELAAMTVIEREAWVAAWNQVAKERNKNG